MSHEPSKNTPEDILHSLVNAAYNRAKYWAGVVLFMQVALFIGGVVAVFFSGFSLTYPWVAVPLAMLSAAFAARAGGCKTVAESLKRHLESWSGFGRQPSMRMLADFRQELPRSLPAEVDQLLRQGNTYASTGPAGGKRAAENLCESSWFSYHLAGWCANALSVVFSVTLVLALAFLFFLATEVPSTTARVYAAKCVSATLLFMMSGGAWRAWQGYKSFSARAKEIDTAAALLAAEATPDVCEVQRLWGEYQLARACAPLIPTWVWRLRRDRLDEGHKTLRMR
jgi:hypothetical protein